MEPLSTELKSLILEIFQTLEANQDAQNLVTRLHHLFRINYSDVIIDSDDMVHIPGYKSFELPIN